MSGRVSGPLMTESTGSPMSVSSQYRGTPPLGVSVSSSRSMTASCSSVYVAFSSLLSRLRDLASARSVRMIGKSWRATSSSRWL